jgi:hypothetical protein
MLANLFVKSRCERYTNTVACIWTRNTVQAPIFFCESAYDISGDVPKFTFALVAWLSIQLRGNGYRYCHVLKIKSRTYCKHRVFCIGLLHRHDMYVFSILFVYSAVGRQALGDQPRYYTLRQLLKYSSEFLAMSREIFKTKANNRQTVNVPALCLFCFLRTQLRAAFH